MRVRTFGQIDGAPVLEAEIGSQAGARAKILTYGAVLRDLRIPVGGALQAVTLGLNSDRRLRPAFAELRRRARPLRQPDRQRPLLDRRRRLHAGSQLPRQSTRCTAGARASASGSGSSAITTPVRSACRWFPRTATWVFPASCARPASIVCWSRRRCGSSARGRRQADARQPDPARLFQSRRLARHSRSRAGAGLRFLHARRRRTDPDRRNPLRRRHALRFPHARPVRNAAGSATTPISSRRARPAPRASRLSRGRARRRTG